jgi:hypothetical protein
VPPRPRVSWLSREDRLKHVREASIPRVMDEEKGLQ